MDGPTSTERRGILIAVEGIDGAGKTTQVHLLADALRAEGHDVVTSKEPTDGPWGRKIRESASRGRLPLHEELEAFVEDRRQHVATLIRPSLEAGKVVILDRYFYSTIAYQGARGADLDELETQMKALAPEPDIVFVLDLDPETAVRRVTVRDSAPNSFERQEALEVSRRIFRQLCQRDPILVEVDSSVPPQELHRSMLDHLRARDLF